MKTSLIALFTIFLAVQASTNDILYQGGGDSTFYYDITGVGPCGPPNGIYTPFPENEGYAMCEWYNPNPKRLIEYGTNNIVAIPNGILRDNIRNYCGKRVIVTIDGVERSDIPLVVWDGCEACNENGGLDFSSTMFAELFGENRCVEGRIRGEMTFRIVDEQIIPLVG